jgi:signal peptidase I
MRLDFPTIMVLLVVVSGLVWAFDALFLARRRRAAAEELPPPKLVEYARSFFPVFLIVLLLRSFLVEPFRIPSGSMMPTLEIGDFILVNKFTYGIRLPVTDRKIFELGRPERGDVVVFRYPRDPSTPFIKRVVGLPGDRVDYVDKTFFVNGTPVKQVRRGIYTGTGSGRSMTGAAVFEEQLEKRHHDILIQTNYPTVESHLVVPEGHYFVLGDNRDNSRDSRYWGTVPDQNLIGRAFTIWMNWDWGHGISWSRIGDSIR